MKPYTTVHFCSFGEDEQIAAEGREINGKPSIHVTVGSESYVTLTFHSVDGAIAFLASVQSAVRVAIEAARGDDVTPAPPSEEPAKEPS